MKFIIGKKIEMTQVFKEDRVIPVTKVKADPCVITQLKNEEKDGYFGVQLAAGERKEKNIKKPQLYHLKKANISKKPSVFKEFRLAEENTGIKVGDMIDVETFLEGDIVDVTGVSKGKGFQGVVKRHGFKGSKKTHGNKDQLRMPGSIGATGPAHVFKGTRMGGRMGGDKVTEKNLEIIGVDIENNILLISGQVPGARNSVVFIKGKGELVISKNKEQEVKEQKTEEKTVEETPKAEEPKKEEAKPASAESSSVAKEEPKVEVKEEQIKEAPKSESAKSETKEEK